MAHRLLSQSSFCQCVVVLRAAGLGPVHSPSETPICFVLWAEGYYCLPRFLEICEIPFGNLIVLRLLSVFVVNYNLE